MLRADDCRSKAAAALHEAEAASNPDTRAALQRLAEQWTALANQIDKGETRLQPRRHPDVADVLRARLRLTDGADASDPPPSE
jgi:hypothetical protein